MDDLRRYKNERKISPQEHITPAIIWAKHRASSKGDTPPTPPQTTEFEAHDFSLNEVLRLREFLTKDALRRESIQAAPAVQEVKSSMDGKPQATPAVPEVTLPTNIEQQERPAELRKKLDITTQRGARRRILESWEDIEKLHGPRPDGTQVHRILQRDKDEKNVEKKTVQNTLCVLRREGLIP